MKAKGMGSGPIHVMVQLGHDRWSTTLQMQKIWHQFDAFERGGKGIGRLPAFTREGLVLASFKLLNATAYDNAEAICLAGAWMCFRRPSEMYEDFPDTRRLWWLINQHKGARLVVISDEGASLQNLRFQLAEPDAPDEALDLRPRTTEASAYEGVRHRSGRIIS